MYICKPVDISDKFYYIKNMYYLEDIKRELSGYDYEIDNPVKLSNGDKSIMVKNGILNVTIWEYIPTHPVSGQRMGEKTISMFITCGLKELAASNGNKRFKYRNLQPDTMVEILKKSDGNYKKLELYCANAVTENILDIL